MFVNSELVEVLAIFSLGRMRVSLAGALWRSVFAGRLSAWVQLFPVLYGLSLGGYSYTFKILVLERVRYSRL